MGASSVERNALHTVVPTSESSEAGTLPRFIEIPTAPTKNPTANFLILRYSRGHVNANSYPQIPKPARPLSPGERDDSIPKRQRKAEVNTVLAIAGGDSRIEISTLTDDQKAFHTAKVNELLNMDKFGVVEVVDRPQSQQGVSTRWVSKQRLDGSHKT